jgi:hypothetical protein
VVQNQEGEAVSFCSFCKSETDHVLQRSMWSCGTHFNDPHWRTKECYKRELNAANDHIKRLEDIINRAAYAFFRDGSDGQVASQMLTILEEVRKP